MAYIQKRGDSYRIRVSCGYDIHGHQVSQAMTWTPSPNMTPNQIKKELQRQTVLFEEECSRGMAATSIKFEKFAERWFEDYAELNHKDTTLQRERNLSIRTYKAIGYLRLDKITARDIQKFSLAKNGTNQKTGKPLSYKTIRHHLSFISTIFEYAIKQDVVSINPCSKVTVPKRTENGKAVVREKKIYTKEQAKELLKILSESTMMYRVYFTLLLYTGCRKAELLGLEWDDFDYDEQTVHIVRTSNYSKKRGMYTDTPKTEKSNRIIALPPEVIELVKQFRSERDIYVREMGDKWMETERLFTNAEGHPMHSNTPYNWLERLCKRHGLPFYGIHTFRHFVASAEIEAGIDPVTVAAMLGHSTPQTTVNTPKGHTHTINNNHAISIQKRNLMFSHIRFLSVCSSNVFLLFA